MEKINKKLNIKKKKTLKSIYYGVSIDTGELCYVDDVENGLNCRCICPSCGTPLEAHQGNKRAHSFAHDQNQECYYGAEIAIYQAFYELIKESKRIFIADAILSVDCFEKSVIAKGCMVKLSGVELNKDPACYPPELFCYAGEERFRVILDMESYFDSHDFVRIEEYAKQTDTPTMVIEINDAKAALTLDLLQKYIDLPNDKQWIYNRRVEHEKRRHTEVTKKQKQLEKKSCEENKFVQKFHLNENNALPEKRIAERIQTEQSNNHQEFLLHKKTLENNPQKVYEMGTSLFGICPQCGKKLKEMPSKNGKAYMCTFGCKLYMRRDSKTGKNIIQKL